jgi:hypothetical protein
VGPVYIAGIVRWDGLGRFGLDWTGMIEKSLFYEKIKMAHIWELVSI